MSRISIVKHMLHFRLSWNKKNIHYRYLSEGSDKFMGPMDAIKLINDQDTVIACGIGGNQRISILSWALREATTAKYFGKLYLVYRSQRDGGYSSARDIFWCSGRA